MTQRGSALAALLILPLLAMPVMGQETAPASPRVQSAVATLRFAPLQRLPRAPAAGASRDLCQHLLVEPRTPAGRQVAAAGWGVTGEVSIGPYQAVSFVGSLEPGTSGSCQLEDGNIGIFRGSALTAIAYAPESGGSRIARAIAFERDALRIWDGDFLSQPVADMRLGADGSLTILPLAAQEQVCGGAASVPNIYGKPIDEARAMLRQGGWSPVPNPGRSADERPDSRVADLVQRGVPEAEVCSGTGFGFCSYRYRGPAGVLNVATVGDNEYPSVSGYDVRCGAPG